jgi:hypothetical protein
VAALAVVEDLDEVQHGGPQRLAGWPVVAVEQLAFQGGEEALGDGVVERVTDGAHPGDQAGIGQAPAERQAGVLTGFKGSLQHGFVGSRVGAR